MERHNNQLEICKPQFMTRKKIGGRFQKSMVGNIEKYKLVKVSSLSIMVLKAYTDHTRQMHTNVYQQTIMYKLFMVT